MLSVFLLLAAAVWMWIGTPISASLQRGVIPGLEGEPFYPPADPVADGVLASAREALLLALAEAEALKAKGNGAFLAKQFADARAAYGEGIVLLSGGPKQATAPVSDLLSTLHTNRAAALLGLGCFKEAKQVSQAYLGLPSLHPHAARMPAINPSGVHY